MRTAETIIANFTKRVSERESIPPNEWMEAAIYLNVLVGNENTKLVEYEIEYGKSVVNFIDIGMSSSEAEKRAKATDEYALFRKQKSFIEQIQEFIRLAKKQATISYENGG